MKHMILFITIVGCAFQYKCIAVPDDATNRKGDTVLIFNSGFEDDVKIVSKADGTNEDKFTGTDNSVSAPGSWDQFQEPLKSIGLQYAGGDTTQRYARIVPDPVNPGNRVLTMRIITPNAGDRSRVQTNVASPGMKEILQSVRVRLHPDMEYLTQYPDVIDWLLLAEWWNDPPKGWNTPNVFRVSLRLRKEKGAGLPLFFKVDAQTVTYRSQKPEKGSGALFHTEWEKVNTDFVIPFGQWMIFEYRIKAGDAGNGRFFMAVTPDNGERQVIFDVKGATQSLLHPAENGFSFWNPMKFYTSIPLTDFMKANDKTYQVYYDDLKILSIGKNN
jgi:hypothetical protein